MSKAFRHLAVLLLMLCLLAGGCKKSSPVSVFDPALAGVYSSGTEMGKMSIILLDDGHAVMGAVGFGALGTWEIQKLDGKDYVVLKLTTPPQRIQRHPVQEIIFLCELERDKKMLREVAAGPDLERARQAIPEHFKKAWGGLDCFDFKTAEIPAETKEMFRDFEKKVEEAKKQYAWQQEWKKRDKAISEAAEPILEEIRRNPAHVLDLELELAERPSYMEYNGQKIENERLKITPDQRAVSMAFFDKEIVFPEEVLIAFLEKHDWENTFNITAMILGRNELTTETRRRLHPRVLEFGKHFPHKLWLFYQNPNTPIDLFKEVSQVDVIMADETFGTWIRNRLKKAEDAAAATPAP